MRFVASRGAVAELLVRAAGESSWPGCRGGAAGTGSRRKQLAVAPWWSCWYGQPAKAAGRGAVAELLVRAAGESSWPGRRGGAAGTGSQRKQLAGALRRDGAKRQSVRKSLPLGERRCGGIEEELAAGRATMRLHRGKACRWASDAAAAKGRCKAASGRC